MFPRLRLLLLCSGVPMLIGLAIAWIVGMLTEGVGDYEIHFRASADGSALTCGRTLDGIGEAKASIDPVDFRFLVSKVELIRYDGDIFPLSLEQDGVWQLRDLAIVDLEDATGQCEPGTKKTRRMIRGSAPKGNYRGVRFMLGRPDGVDLADPAFGALLRGGGMQSLAGTEFQTMRIEIAVTGRPEDAGPNSGSVRIGLRMPRRACTAGDRENCGDNSQVQVTLSDFQPERHVIVAEVGGLVSKALVTRDSLLPLRVCDPAVSDGMCQEALLSLGFAFGSEVARPQLFFTVEGRK